MDQTTLLQEIGLTEKEAEIYQILLTLGVVPAKNICLKTNIPRGSVYEFLSTLEEKGIVESFEQNKKMHFRAKHPLALKEYLDEKSAHITQTTNKLDSVISDFINTYSSAQEKPGVRFYEGIKGFEKVYSDILATQKSIMIFTSSEDRTRPDMAKIIDQNIAKQKKLGITSQALVVGKTGYSKQTIVSLKEKGIDVRLTNDDRFALPSQFIIYGNTVAISSLKNDIVTTIIENEFIALSFKNIFSYIWDVSKTSHDQLFSQLPETTLSK